jgi:hypothetical protein
VHGQVGDQAKVGPFAHHRRPAVSAGRAQRPGDDRSGDLIGAHADALPQVAALGGAGGGRDAECVGDPPQHQRGGRVAAVQPVGIAGDLAGQFGQAHRLPIRGQDPRQYPN